MTPPPRPALVSEQAAARLPRAVLLLFCAAYVLPGLFGREPWKNADITAFGFMASIARGDSAWSDPRLAGLAADGGLLPYWIGAAAIRALAPLGLDPSLAARLPFALLLLGVLALTWYACYHLARTEAAQPLPLPFGGGAAPIDYSRAVADGAVLALIATLGLLQLGHETTPELVQLFGVTLVFYAAAASPFRGARPRLSLWLGLIVLAISAAPWVALWLGAAVALLCGRSAYAPARRFVPWVLGGTAVAAALATTIDAWTWRVGPHRNAEEVLATLRLLVWFAWPTLPLAAFTAWRWRAQLGHRHISLPVAVAAVGLLSCLAMRGHDRALLLALPGLAVLAAFALPTLRRNSGAAIDWFSVFFFSLSALAIWTVWLAMQTGLPPQPAANVARLAPGYRPEFSALALAIGLAATLAWIGLVRWRAGRRRHPLWKSMVLPASGVALCWTLLMSLWLPLLDHARSHRPLMERLAPHLVARGPCIWAPGAPRGLLAALETDPALDRARGARFRVHGQVPREAPPEALRCDTRLVAVNRTSPADRPRGVAPEPEWRFVARAQHPSDRDNWVLVYRRER